MTIGEIYEENGIETGIRYVIAREMEDCYLPSIEERRKYVIDRLKEAGFPNLKTEYLSMIMYARSQDLPLGTPYNIASYALFLSLWANSHDMVAKDLKIMMGDVHIYTNQIELMREQIKRDPRPLPKLIIAPEAKDFLNVDITKTPIKSLYHLEGYDPLPAIRYPSPAV
jgi:thymidylate synthase